MSKYLLFAQNESFPGKANTPRKNIFCTANKKRHHYCSLKQPYERGLTRFLTFNLFRLKNSPRPRFTKIYFTIAMKHSVILRSHLWKIKLLLFNKEEHSDQIQEWVNLRPTAYDVQVREKWVTEVKNFNSTVSLSQF